MLNELQPSVTFSMEVIDPRDNLVTYWFEVDIPAYKFTDIYFGLTRTGEWTTASGTFFKLEKGIKDQALELGRQLLPQVVC